MAAIAIVLAVLLAAEVARLTVSSAVADDNPDLALRLAEAAPAALASKAMAGIGQAAAQGTDPDEMTFRGLRAVAVSDPLRTEPFLVEAAMAEKGGDYDRAKQLLLQARSRDPRSAAARYLYADTAVRQGRIVEGLREMAVLSRLVPGASIQLVPALAQFARTPGSHDKLAGILAQNPQLKNPLLIALAANPDNAGLIVALAGPPSAKPTPDTTAWQTRLLDGLVERGEYNRAYELWRHFAQLPQGPPSFLFNARFRQLAAPPPFNWDLNSSDAGIAEAGNGNLRVLFYGRQEAVLASQLLLLPPGSYRLLSPVVGQIVPSALSWTVTCVGAKASLVELPLDRSGLQQATLSVPEASCMAQLLQLNGKMQDSPQNVDIQIGPLQIEGLKG